MMQKVKNNDQVLVMFYEVLKSTTQVGEGWDAM